MKTGYYYCYIVVAFTIIFIVAEFMLQNFNTMEASAQIESNSTFTNALMVNVLQQLRLA
jgi:hypothetical protein